MAPLSPPKVLATKQQGMSGKTRFWAPLPKPRMDSLGLSIYWADPQGKRCCCHCHEGGHIPGFSLKLWRSQSPFQRVTEPLGEEQSLTKIFGLYAGYKMSLGKKKGSI